MLQNFPDPAQHIADHLVAAFQREVSTTAGPVVGDDVMRRAVALALARIGASPPCGCCGLLPTGAAEARPVSISSPSSGELTPDVPQKMGDDTPEQRVIRVDLVGFLESRARHIAGLLRLVSHLEEELKASEDRNRELRQLIADYYRTPAPETEGAPHE